MNCANVRELLNEYIERNLIDTVSRSISEHLQECKSCAVEESLLRSLSETLHSLPQRSAPMTFANEVMKSLLESKTASEGPAANTGIISSVISVTGLRPAWLGVKMAARSTKVARYVPRPTLKLRTGKARSSSLTKLPLAVGFRW